MALRDLRPDGQGLSVNLARPLIGLYVVLCLYGLGQAVGSAALYVLGAIISGGMVALVWLADDNSDSE